MLYRQALSVDEIYEKIKYMIHSYVRGNIDSLCKKVEFSIPAIRGMYYEECWRKIRPLVYEHWLKPSNFMKLKQAIKAFVNVRSSRSDEDIKKALDKVLWEIRGEWYREVFDKYKPRTLNALLPLAKDVFLKQFSMDLKTYLLNNSNDILSKVDWNDNKYITTQQIIVDSSMRALMNYVSEDNLLLNKLLEKYGVTIEQIKKTGEWTGKDLCAFIEKDIALRRLVMTFRGFRNSGSSEETVKMHELTINELEDLDDDSKIGKPGPTINFDPWSPILRSAPLVLARKFSTDKSSYEDVVLIGRKGQHHMPLLNEHPEVRDYMNDSSGKAIFTCAYLHGLLCFLSNREYNGYSSIEEVAKLISQKEPNILKVYLQPDSLPGVITRKARLCRRIKA